MEYPPVLGGGASYTVNLLKELKQLNVNIILLTNGETDSIEKINDNLTIKRYRTFYDMYYGKVNILKGIDILLKEIREEVPDIIHSFYIEPTLISQIANLNYGIQLITTHTKTPMYREESIKKNSTWSLLDYVNRDNSIRYIAPSNAYIDSLISTGVNPKLIDLVQPGIDRDVFKPIKYKGILGEMRKKLNIKEEDSVILIPCLLRKRKGLSFTSEAISKLDIPNTNIKVILTGTPNNAEEKDIYQEFIKKLDKNIIVEHSEFSDADMPILYSIADITVLCSEAEGYGTVYLEAMSCECPIIGADVVGTNETIRHGFNGTLCKYGDHENLVKAITELLTDKVLRKKYIKNALKLMDTKYNLKKQAKEHLELYERYYKRENIAKCIIFRKKDSKTEILMQETYERFYNLPAVTKNNSESWLEVAIKESRRVTKLNLLLPTHLLLDETNQSEIGYSFEITNINKIMESESRKKEFVKWFELCKAIEKVQSKTDKKLLNNFQERLATKKFNQTY